MKSNAVGLNPGSSTHEFYDLEQLAKSLKPWFLYLLHGSDDNMSSSHGCSEMCDI